MKDTLKSIARKGPGASAVSNNIKTFGQSKAAQALVAILYAVEELA
jgi:hypothetical protein